MLNVIAEAAPTPPLVRTPGQLYNVVEILSNHHKRLLSLVEDYGPKIGDNRFVFPNYLFLNRKPPSWFWGCMGVVRHLKGNVSGAELDRAAAEYERLATAILLVSACKPPAYLASAVVEVRSVDGRVIASVNMFGRNLQARCVN